MPTEAEWKWAAKGGQNQKWAIDPNQDQITKTLANYGNPDSGKTTPVGQYKKANGFGLHDMSGNVWEWCVDWYFSKYYEECLAQGVVVNPNGPIILQHGVRVLRGGSWYNSGFYARSAYRNVSSPGNSHNFFGFRGVGRP